jgi:hypothetical protein
MTEVVEITLPSFDGYQYTGEYRVPKPDEHYLTNWGDGWKVLQAKKCLCTSPACDQSNAVFVSPIMKEIENE